MQWIVAFLLVVLASLISLPAVSVANDDLCRPRDQVLERLVQGGYEPQGGGIADESGFRFHLYRNPDTEDWMIWFDVPDQGKMCPVSTGKDWKFPPPAPPAEPA